MKPPPGRLELAAPATIVLAGADAAQVAALSAALEHALAAEDAKGLPPLRLHRLLDPDAAAAVAGARLALLIGGAANLAQAGLQDRLRAGLAALRLPYAVVPPAPQGLEPALGALRAALREPPAAPRWRWTCPDCDDGDCEAHALGGPAAPRVRA